MAVPNLAAQFADFGALNVSVAPEVYTRTRWDGAWELQPYLYCNSAVWALAPGTGTAELEWKYGLIQQADDTVFRFFLPDDGSRRYVKIVWRNVIHTIGGTTEDLKWFGIVNGVAAKAGGIRSTEDGPYETGAQSIQCVGLERILEDSVIKTSAWSDAGELHYIDRGLTFNADRADGTLGGNMATVGNFVGGLPLFTHLVRDDAAFWTTPYCLQYLIQYFRPKDAAGTVLPFVLDSETLSLLLWTNDRPNMPTHGRTFRELLNQLLPYQRFVSWKVEVDEDTNIIFIRVVSLTGDTLLLPSVDVLVENPRRWRWDMDESRSDAVLTLSHAESVDRCRVQGARATSTFTIAYADSTLEAGYTTAQKTLYDTGATGSTPFAATTNKALQLKLHHARRSQADCHMAYSLFSIPIDWNGVAGNGEGAAGVDFCPVETETPLFQYYPRELYIEPMTALRDGYVYTSLGGSNPEARIPPVKGDTGGPHNHLPIQVWMQVPQSGSEATAADRWVNVEKIGAATEPETVPDDASQRFSVHVSVPRMDRSILLKVSGEPQYVIAGADYTKKTEEPIYTAWDWKTIIATITVKWDAFCEGLYPALADLPANDYIREALFDAGDEYKLDWLVPGTVVSLDTAGLLVRSAAGGWIQDDRKKLADRARLAFAWYGIERRAIQLPTSKINGSIKVGDFVVTAGDLIPHTINTVVTSIRMDCNGPQIPMLTYTTDYVADLDLFLSPNLERSVPKAPPAAVAAAPRMPAARTWETEVPKGPAPQVPAGQFSVTDHMGRTY